MSPAGVLFATFAVLMLLGSPITVALGVGAQSPPHNREQKQNQQMALKKTTRK